MTSRYRRAWAEDFFSMLAAPAKARGLKMEAYGERRCGGIEFKDRAGHYGSLAYWILKGLENIPGPREYTPAELLNTLAEQGLDVRLNRDIASSKRQLAFQFEGVAP